MCGSLNKWVDPVNWLSRVKNLRFWAQAYRLKKKNPLFLIAEWNRILFWDCKGFYVFYGRNINSETLLFIFRFFANKLWGEWGKSNGSYSRSDLLKAYSLVGFRPICFICANRQLVKPREEWGWAILPGKQHGREKCPVIKVMRLSCQTTRTSRAFAARFGVHMFSPHSFS